MIKGLSGDSYINAIYSTPSLPNVSPQNPIPGSVKTDYNGMHVYDGYSWQPIPSSYATITLHAHAQAIMQWADRKMNEEKAEQAKLADIRRLAATNVTIADALSRLDAAKERMMVDVKLAEEQLESVVTLCKEPPINVSQSA